jgi:hypothetical protein
MSNIFTFSSVSHVSNKRLTPLRNQYQYFHDEFNSQIGRASSDATCRSNVAAWRGLSREFRHAAPT